ncbi:MAG: lycopene cyclase domain-containing protein [Bacteroidetes bacterium]|nr:lycopene cyclase domain-containing protein [Bacteroidota bacterium]
MKFLYLLINLFTVIIPFIFSFHPKLNFYKNFKAFFLANSLVGLVFIAWDILFTRIGVWGFNPTYVSGIYLFNLPIEEILFFVCIPFSCVFTYHCLNLFFRIRWQPGTENVFVLALATILMIAGIYFLSKLYTSSTFISLSILLIVLKYVVKIDWLAKLIFIYPILLIPFFVVNGILTGSWLQEPIVWYDNSQNLGIRLLTIPIEDIFYGFELILLNVYLYEKFLTNQRLVLNSQYMDSNLRQ